MEYFYWTDGDIVLGPLSLGELAALEDNEFSVTLVCGEGQNAWRPLAEMVARGATDGIPSAVQRPTPPGGYQKTLNRQSVPISEEAHNVSVTPSTGPFPGLPFRAMVFCSVVCLLAGIGFMWLPWRISVLWVPLFFMSLVLSAMALAQARTVGTIALLLITLLAPPVEWLCHMRLASSKSAAPDVALGWTANRNTNKEASPDFAAPPVNRAIERNLDQPGNTTPERQVAKDRQGQTTDEMRRQLDAVIQESAAVDRRNAQRAQLTNERQPVEAQSAATPRRLPEKTWDRPHVYIQICDELQRPAAQLIKKQLQTNGDVVLDIDNVDGHPGVPTGTSEVRYIVPDDQTEAEEIAGTVRQFMSGNKVATAPPVPETQYVSHSRQYEIWLSKSFRPLPMVSRLDPAVINNWNVAQIQTAIDEIYASHGANFPRKKDQEWAERQSWYHAVPGLTHDSAEQLFTVEERADVELLAARRAALAGREKPLAVTTQTPSPAMIETPVPSATPAYAELSPERVVTEVWNTDPQMTAANFRSRYADKVVRYTGTVVRKNAKEQLLVFRGGGFMASAYDVQATLKEDQNVSFRDVVVGDRLSLVAKLDRIVPPALGVGSCSIRLSEAEIHKKSR